MALRWSNIPIPEGHVVAIVIGLGLHYWRPIFLTEANGLGALVNTDWFLILLPLLAVFTPQRGFA